MSLEVWSAFQSELIHDPAVIDEMRCELARRWLDMKMAPNSLQADWLAQWGAGTRATTSRLSGPVITILIDGTASPDEELQQDVEGFPVLGRLPSCPDVV